MIAGLNLLEIGCPLCNIPSPMLKTEITITAKYSIIFPNIKNDPSPIPPFTCPVSLEKNF